MRWPWKRTKRTPPTPEDLKSKNEKAVTDYLHAQLELLREQYLIVRDPDGTWTAYHKDPEHGSWFVWRRLRYVPELRAEKEIRPFTEATEHPDSVSWDVPDTFPEDWTNPNQGDPTE